MSCAVKRVLVVNGVHGVEFSEIDGFDDGVLMHVSHERPLPDDERLSRCSACHARVYDSRLISSLAQISVPDDVDVQVMAGVGLVVRERVADLLRSSIDASTYPPSLQRVGLFVGPRSTAS